MFRNNRLGSILVLLLFVLGLSACLWVLRYYIAVRESRSLVARYSVLKTTQDAIISLARETVDYSTRNPDLDPILIQFNFKARPSTNAPAGARPAR